LSRWMHFGFVFAFFISQYSISHTPPTEEGLHGSRRMAYCACPGIAFVGLRTDGIGNFM
jgi:hypothetical protein